MELEIQLNVVKIPPHGTPLSLNLPEPSGPVKARNGIAVPITNKQMHMWQFIILFYIWYSYMPGRHSDIINTQIVYMATWEKFPRSSTTT
jgi:hypothetical protein